MNTISFKKIKSILLLFSFFILSESIFSFSCPRRSTDNCNTHSCSLRRDTRTCNLSSCRLRRDNRVCRHRNCVLRRHEGSCRRCRSYPCPTFSNPRRQCDACANDPVCITRKAAINARYQAQYRGCLASRTYHYQKCRTDRAALNRRFVLQYNGCKTSSRVRKERCDAVKNTNNERYRAAYRGCSIDARRLRSGCVKKRNAINSVATNCRAFNRELDNLKNSINKIGRQISQKTKSLGNKKVALKNVNIELRNSEDVLKNAIIHSSGLGTLKGLYDGVKELKKMTNKDIILFDTKTVFKQTYNALGGTYWGQYKLPGGITLDANKIQAALSGSFALPDFDPLEFVSDFGVLKGKTSNDFKNWERSKKSNNHYVYTASNRFVESIAFEKIADDIVAGIFSGGATVEGSLYAIKELLLQEWVDIYAWLKSTGNQEAIKIAGELVKTMFKKIAGKGANFSFPTVRFDSSIVNYNYSINPTLPKEITKNILPYFFPGSEPLKLSVTSKHPAFHIKISKSRHQSIDEMITEFTDLMKNGPTIDIEELLNAAGVKLPFDISMVNKVIKYNGAESIKKILLDKLIRTIGLDLRSLKRFLTHDGKIDLTNSRLGKSFEKNLNKLALGNKGYSKLTALKIDVRKKTIIVAADMHHIHSYGTVNEMINNVDNIIARAGGQTSKFFKDTKREISKLKISKQDINREIANLKSSASALRNRLKPLLANKNKLCKKLSSAKIHPRFCQN